MKECHVENKDLIIQYVFDEDMLRYWKKGDENNSEHIDLNEFINWRFVHDKALGIMKHKFPDGTTFVDIDME